MIEIRYHKDVLLYLDELTDILIDKEYFAFYEASAQYIADMVDYIKDQIGTNTCRFAPSYFSRYGKNLFYITYNRNRRTTWYIFFQKFDQYYFIRHITNNHVAGQYFNFDNPIN